MKSKFWKTVSSELWNVRNPHLKDNSAGQQMLEEKLIRFSNKEIPSKKIFFELVTARNRNLINIEEQNKLRKTVVGFFGLSVGAIAALTWMLQSRADCIKIVDYDKIAPTNLNRLPFGWGDIGKLKTDVLAQRLLEINPFAKVVITNNKTAAAQFKLFEETPKLDFVIDEIDDIEGKLNLRKLAKKKKLPLIQAADVGDNVFLDVERYDLEPQPKFFLDRIPNVEKIDFSSLSRLEKRKLIINLVGLDRNSEKMLLSLMAIGGSVTTWPQLGATATISGGLVATAIKKIVLGENVESGRYYFSQDEILVNDFQSSQRTSFRNKLTRQIKTLLERNE